MRRLVGALFGIVATVGIGGVAHADWQYAKWGMSPTALAQSPQGQVKFMSRPGERSCMFKRTTCLAFSPSVTIPPYTFEARFGFADDGNGGLNSVLLIAGPGQFWELARALGGKYGDPISGEDGFLATRIWRDPAGGNLIRLMDMYDQVIIQYQPIVNGL